MRRRPWYAPPFHDWSETGPGVSNATLNVGPGASALVLSRDFSAVEQAVATVVARRMLSSVEIRLESVRWFFASIGDVRGCATVDKAESASRSFLRAAGPMGATFGINRRCCGIGIATLTSQHDLSR